MNDLFADRHREISIDLAGVDLAARWAAVEVVAAEASADQTAQLVEIAFGMNGADDEWFRRPFKDREAAFPMRSNRPEMAMLAVTAVEEILHGQRDSLAILVASLCDTAGYLGTEKAPTDLIADARDWQLVEGARRRTPPAPPAPEKPVPIYTKPIEDELKQHETASYVPATVVISTVASLGGNANKAIKAAHGYIDAVAKWAARRALISEEETAMMWWLLGGRSTTLNRRWSDLPLATAAVVAGQELAALAAMLPAPPQADAMLAQQLLFAGQQPDTNAVPVPLELPVPIAQLLRDPATSDDVEMLARHNLRRALAVRAWQQAAT